MAKNNYENYGTIEEIYVAVLRGELGRLPRGTLKEDDSMRRILIHFFENIMQWSRDEIAANLDGELLKKYKLLGIYSHFNGGTYDLLNFTYPGEYMPWELKKVPQNYWNEETYAIATRWLFEEKLKWSHEDVCNNLSYDTFRYNGLYGMVQSSSNDSYNLYDILEFAYPGQYHPWNLPAGFRGIWDKQGNLLGAVRDLIGNKLRWSVQDVYDNFNAFTLANLAKFSNTSSANSGLQLLFEAYPRTFYPWKFKTIYNGFWRSGDNITWYVYHNVVDNGIGYNDFVDRLSSDIRLYTASRRYFNDEEIIYYIARAYDVNYFPPY
ncbi:hypothetical protein ABGV42_00915 [Paenibacillus pabuli]|uniref:hypothetical protein n=1 Tax=Paenibacillus pabuli TaxID=1472 RepID=UPI003241DF22